ncbi:hypothetical protein O7632_01290 [Solwaraspora sp. WMMD406]|uniref:hypothetical protein n=1 Tax=Solwaraspora sp. WMMD406 TaxID=3016095 RepID=UPI002416F608|nr:hypothetical protein [Solwaraspora sp. WMMD406]MDG4762757.1 hypothetical protein [Solwaraspora sp. WMMD406]
MSGPTADPPPAGEPARPGRRPLAVVFAVLLMVPAAVVWLIAGVGFVVATARSEGSFKWLLWIVGLGILGICLLVVAMTLAGMWLAWAGDSNVLRVPAGFTVGLFVVVLVTLLAQGRLDYQPTMTTPLVIGTLAGISLVLLHTPAARRWLAAPST